MSRHMRNVEQQGTPEWPMPTMHAVIIIFNTAVLRYFEIEAKSGFNLSKEPREKALVRRPRMARRQREALPT